MLNPNLLVNECQYFAKIGCSLAYLQMSVDEETADLLMIGFLPRLPRGLFRVSRLIFAVAPVALAIWQENMYSLFRLLKGVRVF